MSIEEGPYVGDIGTEILVDTGSDLTDSTKVSFKVKKPSADVEVEWIGEKHTETLQEYVDATTANLTDDEFSGMDPGDNVTRRIKYITKGDIVDEDDDFSVAGTYKIQSYSESPTWTGRGNTFEQKVKGHYK